MWERWAHRRTRKLEMNTIYFEKKKSEMQRRQKNNESVKERTVTGRSGSCIQKEQFKLPSRTSITSFSPSSFASSSSSSSSSSFSPLFLFFFLSSASSSQQAFPLTSSCRFFAFSRSVRDASASIARIFEIRSSEAPPAAFPTGAAAAAETRMDVQSGHSQWRAEASVSGRVLRQARCQGVTQVLQVSLSSSDGFSLHTMHAPSPSHGNSLTGAMALPHFHT